MLAFSALLVRAYYAQAGWNEDNFYANLARSSSAILDFAVPPTLSLQIAKAPTDIFYTSYALDALPHLNGSVSYITSSVPLGGISPSRTVPLRTIVDHFHVFPPPKRPLPPAEEYLAGDLVTQPRDYLLYSRIHFPSCHLSALATTRVGQGCMASLAFMHSPKRPPSAFAAAAAPTNPDGGPASATPSQSTVLAPPPPPGNVILSFQQDTGRWSTEYTYSATDGMLGFRGLYNFGLSEASLAETVAAAAAAADDLPASVNALQHGGDKPTRIDEEEAMEGGLRGRFSAGGEIYFSRKQRSLGGALPPSLTFFRANLTSPAPLAVSTGLRFTTIPASSSPPTTLTLLYNPLMGFLSTAYAAQISPHLALSSRYGVNVYSYESDLCVGGEWWIGSGRGKGGWRGLRHQEGEAEGEGEGGESRSFMQAMRSHSDPPPRETDRDGVLKAKISGNGLISLLYESRIRKCLVSVGVVSDLSSRSNPVRTIGMEVQYFSD